MWRPRVDVPELTRCCFCLPLRYGLLGWGYIKVIGLLVAESFLCQELSLNMNEQDEEVPLSLVILILVITVDLFSTTIFILAGHMKHCLLYKVYYNYSVTFLIAFILNWVSIVIDQINDHKKFGMTHGYHVVAMYMTFHLFVAAPIVVVQLYVTLLVRSELRKLSNSDVQFVNNVAMFVSAENEETA